MLRINKIHWPVSVLGFGRRIGIWTQGCSIRCKGCCSTDTWHSTDGVEMRISDMLAACKLLVASEQLDGITISGGEPFDQPFGLKNLLVCLNEWRKLRVSEGNSDFDILCYSGYSLEHLQTRFTEILVLLDCIICDPFVQGKASVLLRGSQNQRIVPLTELGVSRLNAQLQSSQTKRLQFHLDSEQIWFVGIPAEGDLERLTENCRQRGLHFDNVSWRS